MEFPNEKQRTKFTTSTPVYSMKRLYNKMAEYISTVSDSFSFENEKTSTSLDNKNKSSVDTNLNLSKETVNGEQLNIDLNTAYDQTINKSSTSSDEAINSDQESMILSDKSTSYNKSSILFKTETKSSLNIYDNESCIKNNSCITESDENIPIDECSREKDVTINSDLDIFAKMSTISEQDENITENDSTSLASLKDCASNDKQLGTHIASDATVGKQQIEKDIENDCLFFDTLNEFSSTLDSLEDIDSTSSTCLKDNDSFNDEIPCNHNTKEAIELTQQTEKHDMDDEYDYLLADDLDEVCSTPDSLEESLLMADSPMPCLEDNTSNDRSTFLCNAKDSTDSTQQVEKHKIEDDYLFSDSVHELGSATDFLEENIPMASKDSDSFCSKDIASDNDNSCLHNATEATEQSQQMEKQNIDEDYLFSDTLNEFGSTPDLPEENLSISDVDSPKRKHIENSVRTNSLYEYGNSISGNKSYKTFEELSSMQNLSTLCNTSSENYTTNFHNFQWSVPGNNNDTSVKKLGNSLENFCQNAKDSSDVIDPVSNDVSSENYTKHLNFCNFNWHASENMKDTLEQVQKIGNSVENSCQNDKDSRDIIDPVSNDVSSENYTKHLNFHNFKWHVPENMKDTLPQVKKIENSVENSCQNDKESRDEINPVSNDASSEKYTKHLNFCNFKLSVPEKIKDTSAQVKNFGHNLETSCQNDTNAHDVIAPVSNEILCNADVSGLSNSDNLKSKMNIPDKDSDYMSSVTNDKSILGNDENANSPKEQLFRTSPNLSESDVYNQMNLDLENVLQNKSVLESRLQIIPSVCNDETAPKTYGVNFTKEECHSSSRYKYPVSPINVEIENSKDTSEFPETAIQEETPKEHLFNNTSNLFDQSEESFMEVDYKSNMEVDNKSNMEVDNKSNAELDSVLSKTSEDNSSVTDYEMNTNSSDVDLNSPPEATSSPELMETDIIDAEPGPSNRHTTQKSFNLLSHRNRLKQYFTAKIAVEKAVKRALLKSNNKNRGLTLNQILKYINQNKLLNAHSKMDQDVRQYLEEAQKLNELKLVRDRYIIGNQERKNSTLQKNKQVLQDKPSCSVQNDKSYSLRSKSPYSLRSKANKKNFKLKILKTPKLNKYSKKTPQRKMKNQKKTPKSVKGSVFKKLRSRTVLKKK